MKIKKVLLTSSLVLAGIAGQATTVFAADATPAPVNTQGDVTFKQGTNPLRIDKASDLHFGQQEISAEEKTYTAALDGTDPNFVQVTDVRGTNVGWKLQVAEGAQLTSNDETAKQLTGAVITLDNINLTTVDTNLAGAPTAGSTITLVPGTGATPGAAFDVATAAADQGMGTWKANFGTADNGDQSVKLTVPGATQKVKDAIYATTLTWTLNDTPA